VTITFDGSWKPGDFEEAKCAGLDPPPSEKEVVMSLESGALAQRSLAKFLVETYRVNYPDKTASAI
jgi:hypothetical protein